MNQAINRLHADRDRVLHAITGAPDSANFLVLYTRVKTLTRSIQHIIVTAENEKREQTQYEEGHITAWTSTLRTIEQNLDALKKGK